MHGKWNWRGYHGRGWNHTHWDWSRRGRDRRGYRFWMPWPALGLLFLLLLGWKMIVPLAALGVLFFVILPALKGAACDRPEGDPGKRKNDDPWRGEKRKNDDAPATFRTRDGEELEII